ncbi:hypothetical protein H310_08965 [Aphanomyces invadans]|uniref:Fibronectin type-III domain-containing protein n=1 Tax=Aphanomyces invadans TaxID=157072 RepID=A0A024TY16_9STRA|nr:hypothetical protein H310_08965 [Aphanomyces invadans]ETV98247.1 hypothetical protein H310_08965 [Aphanomyces invadans]|eukprot:XP_008873122.1 hypothetical protein H310_08965 [Aphanomyces invadans]
MQTRTPHQRHHDKVEKRLLEKFGVRDVLVDSDEHAKINEMVSRVATLAAEDNLREDGFFFADGVYTASRMYKMTPGMVNRSFTAHVKPVYSVLPFSDGMHVATVGMDSMCVWAMDQVAPVASLGRSAVTSNMCITIGAASASNVAICAGTEPTMCRWDKDAAKITLQHRGTFGHDDIITSCCFSPDESVFVTASMDSTCIFWDANTMKLIGVLPAHHGGVSWCGFAGRYLYTCSALDYLIKRWDVAAWLHAQKSDALSTGNSGDPSNKDDASDRTALTGHSSAAHDVTPTAAHAPTPNDTRATPFTPSSAKIVPSTLETPSQLEPSKLLDWTARQKYNRALDALFSPDVTLQTLTVGHHLPQFCLNDDWTHNRHRDSSDFDLLLPPLFPFRSPDDGATEGLREADDDPVKLAQLESIDILTLLDPSSSIRHPLCNERVTFHANDIFLDDAAVVEFQKRSAQGVFVQHTHTINWCAVGASSADAISTDAVDVLVSVSSDKCIKFWNAACGTHMHTIRNAHDRDILTCALSAHPTTAYLATGSSDSFVKIWNPSTFECVFTLRGHYDSVLSVSFTPTGHCVYSSGRDAQVIKWQVIPTEPDVPAQPVVFHVDCHAITITWTEPLGNGSRIDKYQIKVSKDQGAFGAPFDVPAEERMHTVVSLDPGCTYTFCVAAINRIGSSAFSVPTMPVETVAYRPSTIKKPCRVSDVGTRSVVLEWFVPSANGARISHYHVRCIPEDPLHIDATVDVTVSVEAIAAEHQAAQDAIQADKDRKDKVREARRLAAKTKRRQTCIERSDKLRQQSERRVERLATGGASTAAVTAHVAPEPFTLKYTIHCVQPGMIYQFQIAAENRCGVGDYNVPSSYVKTISCAPDAPAAPTIGNVASHSVDMTWVKPRHNGSDIVHYTLEWAQDGRDVESTIVLARSLPSTLYTITALDAGRSMRVRLQASNVIDKKVLDSPFSPWSDIVATLPSVPAAPAMPVLTAATSHTLTMTFHAPCDNGQPILRYYVMVFVDDDSYGVASRRFVEQIVWPVDALHGAIGLYEMNLVGLRGTKRYVVSISAENALGKGDFSPVSHALATKPAIVPDVVPAPKVLNVEPTKVDLEWTVPSHDGGSPLIAYSIDYSTNDGPFESEFKLHRMDTRLTLDFLKPKTTYSFRVAAVNAAGMATYSTPTAKTVTPSLVEHTLRQYFLHRPPEEHNAATSIQKQFRWWKTTTQERAAFAKFMRHSLDNWNLL